MSLPSWGWPVMASSTRELANRERVAHVVDPESFAITFRVIAVVSLVSLLLAFALWL